MQLGRFSDFDSVLQFMGMPPEIKNARRWGDFVSRIRDIPKHQGQIMTSAMLTSAWHEAEQELARTKQEFRGELGETPFVVDVMDLIIRKHWHYGWFVDENRHYFEDLPTGKDLHLFNIQQAVSQAIRHRVLLEEGKVWKNTSIYLGHSKTLIKNGVGAKIGESKDVPKRINDLNQTPPFDLQLVDAISDCPRSVEKSILDCYWSYRIKGEWFRAGVKIEMQFRDLKEIINYNWEWYLKARDYKKRLSERLSERVRLTS